MFLPGTESSNVLQWELQYSDARGYSLSGLSFENTGALQGLMSGGCVHMDVRGLSKLGGQIKELF